MCQDGRYLDEALVQDLTTQIDSTSADHVVVVHKLGNHGPSYYKRYPVAFERFVPTCNCSDLATCSRQRMFSKKAR
ncbi:sulfatase-like hydrolase/transferase [Halomonas sp. 5021]|uniref:sulfatase-like hydrolase/transferase n=1 Tax=Halomonas sp. 5021 TaxID=3082156 RepID=UPI002FCAE97B